MSDAAKKVEERIRKAQAAEMDAEISKIYDDIIVKNGKNEQIPENVFVDNFLPFFAGKVQDNADLKIMTNWIGVAGSPMNEVDVVDASGKVIFTVPPIYSTNFLSTSARNGPSFNDIVKYAQIQSTRIPDLGDRIIGTDGVNMVAAMAPNPADKHTQAWKKIHDRYNIKPTADMKIEGEKTQSSDGADDLDF